MSRVLLLTDPAMELHAAPGHPERPARLGAVTAGVADGAAATGAQLERRTPEPAEPTSIERVHPAAYVATLDRLASDGGGWLDPDTYVGPGSMQAARLAAGATVEAGRVAVAGEAEVAFAVVRPPGHHATASMGSGFCLLNNVAIAAAQLRAAGLARRIAIVDFDVHHGNGTQAIFDADPDVCYASTHQARFYPGTGALHESGVEAGTGTMHNVPLDAGSSDGAFLAAWRERLLPAIETFAPEAILVSAGFDAHRNDPLAMLEVTEDGYRALGEALGALGARIGLAGIALTLEGGYDLDALRASSAATVEGLLAGLGSS